MALEEAEIHKRVEKIHEGRISMLKYGGRTMAKSVFLCNVCGYEWEAAASDVTYSKKPTGCSECDRKSKLKDEQQIHADIACIHEGRVSMLKYGGTVLAKSVFLCNVCGHTWETAANHVTRPKTPSGCSECDRKSKLKDEQQIHADIARIHEGRVSMLKYGGTTQVKSIFLCNICGYEWEATANSVTGKRPSGCGKCKLSKGELLVAKGLDRLGIYYEIQAKFKKCKDKRRLPFDLYLPDYKVLIEVDGDHHYPEFYEKNKHRKGKRFSQEKRADVEKKDAIKTQFAKDYGYELIRFKHTLDDPLTDHEDYVISIISHYTNRK